MRSQNSYSRSCPSCRRRIDKSSISPVPKILDNILDELIVKCPLRSEGCPEEVPRCRVQDHVIKYCEYFEVDCPSQDCLLRLQRRQIDGDRCLHRYASCEDCKQLIIAKDLESDQTLYCEISVKACPDGEEQVPIRSLEAHIECCPKSLFPCTAAAYGCDYAARRIDLDDHLKICAIAKLAPFLKTQKDRSEAHETMIKDLRHKNTILETSLATILETLGSSKDPVEGPSSLTPEPYSDHLDSAFHLLLSLHESLREEVSRVSAAVSEVDAKASMMVINEALRSKQDLAHINAAIGSMRAQLQWLTSAKLQNQQRVAMAKAQISGHVSNNTAPSSLTGS